MDTLDSEIRLLDSNSIAWKNEIHRYRYKLPWYHKLGLRLLYWNYEPGLLAALLIVAKQIHIVGDKGSGQELEDIIFWLRQYLNCGHDILASWNRSGVVLALKLTKKFI